MSEQKNKYRNSLLRMTKAIRVQDTIECTSHKYVWGTFGCTWYKYVSGTRGPFSQPLDVRFTSNSKNWVQFCGNNKFRIFKLSPGVWILIFLSWKSVKRMEHKWLDFRRTIKNTRRYSTSNRELFLARDFFVIIWNIVIFASRFFLLFLCC